MSTARRLDLIVPEQFDDVATAALPEIKLFLDITYGPTNFFSPPGIASQQLTSQTNSETSIRPSGQTSAARGRLLDLKKSEITAGTTAGHLRSVEGNTSVDSAKSELPTLEPSLSKSASMTSLSLGLNILGAGQKICSFDCPYCDLGATTTRLNRLKRDIEFPSPEQIKRSLLQALRDLHQSGPAFDSICFSGNGEPTLHPDFPEVVQAVIEARDELAPGKPIRIFSNGSTLDSRKVVEAMNRLDECIVKIDAGNEKLFKTINAPFSRTTLSRILSGIRQLKEVTIQSLFVKGIADNTLPLDLDDWIEAIALIKPKRVVISTVTHKPATSGVIKLDEDALYTISSRLERKTAIRAHVIF